MDVEKIEQRIESSDLSRKTLSWMVAILFVVVIGMGGLIYKLAIKPAPEIKESNALQFLNNNDVNQNENILELRKEVDRLQDEIDKLKK
jgi:cytoskeletal protein RodZ